MQVWKLMTIGMMMSGLLFLAGCPGDLENAQEQATGADKAKKKVEGTLDDCLNACQEAEKKQEAECKEALKPEETADKTSFDSPWLACENSARGDLTGCQVECNAKFR